MARPCIFGGRKGTRTPDLLCVREIHRLSTVSAPHIWYLFVHTIAQYGLRVSIESTFSIPCYRRCSRLQQV
jgi:hypothetical protein